MKMFDFYLQDLDVRARIALERGKHIGSRQDKAKKFDLYYLDNFYVEVCYKKDNQLSAVRGFTNPDLLDPYLEHRQVMAR